MYIPILCVAMAICTVAVSTVDGGAEPSPADAASARVQVLSASQMSKSDADVLTAHREVIVSAAELNGYDIRSGAWIQNQVLCPDAPRHVIMHYLKISPDGSVSLFTAAVPRNDGGHERLQVRIVPVLYHGAPAFHVFGSSPSQRELMNEVISTRVLTAPGDSESNWTALALCYAALAGAEPASKSVTAPEETTPILEKGSDGKVLEMRFSVVGPDHLAQDWRIIFDNKVQVKTIVLTTKDAQTPQPVPVATPAKQHPIPQ